MSDKTRRQFLAALPAAAAVFSSHAYMRAQARDVRIDGRRLRERVERLSVFGRPAGGTFADGVSRTAYSDADLAGRRFVMDEIKAAGLEPRIDPAGNIFARRRGGSGPPILFGSHIDSVPNGGNFDGDLGSHPRGSPAERRPSLLSRAAHRARRHARTREHGHRRCRRIVAIDRYEAVITGFANHAGTTPIVDRRTRCSPRRISPSRCATR